VIKYIKLKLKGKIQFLFAISISLLENKEVVISWTVYVN
jgi:hypothetical protein